MIARVAAISARAREGVPPAPCPGASPTRFGRPDGSVGFLMEYALGGPVEVVILPGPERPHERCEAREAETECNRYQVKVILHSAASRMAVAGIVSGAALAAIPSLPFRRSALATTRIDDADIATAAISGVTRPMMATGTATML